ncbi:DNA circularization N-terminal domain-containing protein [Rhodopseudomonas sp. HC1]|uniref:DNA circularization N-terminal domain-containing protein n=1 Tax=Rhodopseudomonas infernalis TaxID=2897386 RepID=UPI001EE8AAC8|nr:DNA circularization N-terminal domain-containing protein [Rhodopseudomonas infernalis]MCG6204201.1 DNA circularization N-terminal domain-containing protein [Rhodopseudomonas infernalis]
MALARDWTKTLWMASYKGVPFWVEDDGDDGARRIVIHEFPMRDDPFLEDLGERSRQFEVTAYVASDSADADAAAVIATCATRGAGILVLPTHGPILVRCLTFRRDRRKDRAGFIALALMFVREGASSALVSGAQLANMVFLAAENASVALSRVFASTVVATGADFVVDEAVGATLDAVSALEVIRTGGSIDLAVSTVQRARIDRLFDGAEAMIAEPAALADIPVQIVSIARALGDGMAPEAAVVAFGEVATEPSIALPAGPVFYGTPSAAAAARNRQAANQVLRIAALAAYAEAVARVQLSDRQAGIRLRADTAEFFEAELLGIGAEDIDLSHAVGAIRDAVIDYLSRVILDLAPVMNVAANMSMPSLYWAWRLYADPTRSGELVARNRVVHPSFMPPAFEALAR